MGVTTGHVVCRVRKALSVYINFYNNNLFKHFSMKKFFLFCMIALVGMCGLNSCSDDCNHDYIEYDYSQALVGTWTCIEEDYAEAWVIKADGSLEVTGVVDGEYFQSKGTIQVKNNKMIYKIDNGDEWEGRFEMIAGQSFSMILSEELDVRYTYHYCENDLADELVGLWVCHEGLPDVENDMAVVTYSENGKMTMTTQASAFIPADLVNTVSSYVVVGDLLFMNVEEDGIYKLAARLDYTPNGTSLGDIFTQTLHAPTENGVVMLTSSFLRIKQHLELEGQTYDYSAAYVSNAKGTDEDFIILDHTFNIANIEGSNFDMLFRSELFCVDLNAKSIKQRFRYHGRDIEIEIPITVDGNKVTLDLSAENPAYRKVEMYMFQDKDNTQMHMYMHTNAFINYFANMELYNLLAEGKIDPTDTAALEKVFTDMEERIESINVSFVFKARE